jgi:hypothetical protein
MRSVYCWEVLYTVGKIEEGGIFGGFFVEFFISLIFVSLLFLFMMCIGSAFKFDYTRRETGDRVKYEECILLGGIVYCWKDRGRRDFWWIFC